MSNQAHDQRRKPMSGRELREREELRDSDSTLSEFVVCPECGGDGKETCTNPDHGFINVLYFHDIGRVGCPVCGHDPHHKVKNGGPCLQCDGAGILERVKAEEYCRDMDLDAEDLRPATEDAYK